MTPKQQTSPRNCPIARSLEIAGDLWSVLIIRDALYGLTRFDEFQSSLKIAPNILTRRLKDLVAAGMLDRRPYQTKPVRHEYVLTDKGRAFRPVLWTLLAWGNEYLCPDGHLVDLVDPETNAKISPLVVDASTHRPLADGVRVMPGPAATPNVIARYGNRGFVA
jgi:DNA-binding HxlR family transcriptional regulator